MSLQEELWKLAVSSSHQGEAKTLEQLKFLLKKQIAPLYSVLLDAAHMLAVYTEGKQNPTTRTQALMTLTEAYEALNKAKKEHDL